MSEADVVRRYFGVVADLGSTDAALRALLHPDVRLVEHPNRFAPDGAVRDLEGIVAGFHAGKRLLASQAIEIHEIVACGPRVAVRATWRGTVGPGGAGLKAGTELVTRLAAFLTVEGGLICAHETYDCVASP